ncbi:SGNH/GDSL hydrolase family protein [Paenibacillus eucommiae]|uniref:Lysophospholipase L1-like esterase n=1 Tax=Paenibacillus eucommiae TaxID=1355755 RepID=A0ABS4IT55_9BACL|nr:SGNH/GDSL hydrolase family protein [Paenibacillus eucommiae]MBP1990750.1 lysophospholipase L1-like esterase [Paenibacillus eucommiae]
MPIHDGNDPVSMLSFLHTYAAHLQTSSFPVVTENRRKKKTVEREIVLLGDSHSWGQGSTDSDTSRYYSSHMAYPYSKGYYASLAAHVRHNLEMYPSPLVPFLSKQVSPISGLFKTAQIDLTKPISAKGFYAATALGDEQAVTDLGYLAEASKFDASVCVMAPGDAGSEKLTDAVCRIEMEAHARELFIAVLAGPHGAKLEVALQTQPYYDSPPDYPKVFRVISGNKLELGEQEGGKVQDVDVVGNGDENGNGQAGTHAVKSIWIDTYAADGLEETVYCIDYGVKQKGTLTFSYAGASEKAERLCIDEVQLGTPALLIRGVVFDGNQIRNFSMGGHTVGQWLGDNTHSYNDGPHPHVDHLLNYVPFTPTLVIIQAPIVNEYLRQTELAQFTSHLTELIQKLNGHLNETGERKMDVLMFTTLGDQNIQFKGAPSLPISYDQYYDAVKQYCSEHSYGIIDFRQFFVDKVEAGQLDDDLLFDDAIHPSPFANAFIAKGLTGVWDLLW